MQIDRNGFEVLARDECLRLLDKATIGRIGFSHGALPTVLPVNFCLYEERILVRTGPGSKLDAALEGAVVAFEVDDFDAMYHAGWSVVVTGRAETITDPADLAAIKLAPLTRWAPLGTGHVIAISTEFVSGRRLRKVALAQPA